MNHLLLRDLKIVGQKLLDDKDSRLTFDLWLSYDGSGNACWLGHYINKHVPEFDPSKTHFTRFAVEHFGLSYKNVVRLFERSRWFFMNRPGWRVRLVLRNRLRRLNRMITAHEH